MLSRQQYTTVCDNLDEILHAVPDSLIIADAVRHLQVLLTERLLTDVKKVTADKHITAGEISIGQERGKIPCIKSYRERTGAGLKEAKDMVEDYFTKYNLSFGQASW